MAARQAQISSLVLTSCNPKSSDAFAKVTLTYEIPACVRCFLMLCGGKRSSTCRRLVTCASTWLLPLCSNICDFMIIAELSATSVSRLAMPACPRVSQRFEAKPVYGNKIMGAMGHDHADFFDAMCCSSGLDAHQTAHGASVSC